MRRLRPAPAAHREVWHLILSEAAGEVAAAVLQLRDVAQHFPQYPNLQARRRRAIRDELIQVAEVAVCWIEHLDTAEEARRDAGQHRPRPHLRDRGARAVMRAIELGRR